MILTARSNKLHNNFIFRVAKVESFSYPKMRKWAKGILRRIFRLRPRGVYLHTSKGTNKKSIALMPKIHRFLPRFLSERILRRIFRFQAKVYTILRAKKTEKAKRLYQNPPPRKKEKVTHEHTPSEENGKSEAVIPKSTAQKKRKSHTRTGACVT